MMDMKLLLILAVCIAVAAADCRSGLVKCQSDFISTNGDLYSNQIFLICLQQLVCVAGTKEATDQNYWINLVQKSIQNLSETGQSSASIPVMSAVFVTSVAVLTILKTRFR